MLNSWGSPKGELFATGECLAQTRGSPGNSGTRSVLRYPQVTSFLSPISFPVASLPSAVGTTVQLPMLLPAASPNRDLGYPPALLSKPFELISRNMVARPRNPFHIMTLTLYSIT